MSISVIAIHTHPFEGFADTSLIFRIYQSYVSLAVPFFFMTSGFLLAASVEKEQAYERKIDKVRRQLFRLLNLYLIWTVIYLPITIFGFNYQEESVIKAIILFFRNVLCQGENFMSWHLWYLHTSVVAVFVIYGISSLRKKLGIPYYYTAFLLIMYFLIEVIYGYNGTNAVVALSREIIENTILSNRMFSGMLFVFIWYWILMERVRQQIRKSDMFGDLCTSILSRYAI